MDVVVRGRIAIWRLRAIDCTSVDVVNIHVVDSANLPLHAQFARLRRHLTPLAQAHTILMGDMNFVAAGEGRLQANIWKIIF